MTADPFDFTCAHPATGCDHYPPRALNADTGVLCLTCYTYHVEGAPCPNGCVDR